MLRAKRRPAGAIMALLLGVGSAFACVSGSAPSGGGNQGNEPDCYSNQDCTGANECSGGMCVPVQVCGSATACRPGDACLQGGCRSPCQGTVCANGLVCDAGFCIPAPNPMPPTGGSGGVGISGSGGSPMGGQPPTGGVGGFGNEGGVSGTLGGGGFGNVGNEGGAAGTVAGGGFGNMGGQGGSMSGGTGGAGQGGTAGKGGTAGQGGTGGKGGTAGQGGTGGKGGTPGCGTGASPTACNIGGQHNGDGSFTWYHFSQGTGQENGSYVTACGFRAPTSGTSGTRDTVENIANQSPASASYFVAIPAANPQNFDTSIYCGACVELSGMSGQRVVATVVDMCPINSNPRCSQGAHLDVSKTAFDQLGFSRGDPTGTSWRFVPCPITGNVKVRMKTGNNNEFFVENGYTSITAVTVNGTNATRTYYGAWHVNSAISHPATLNLTDKAGRTLSVVLNNSTSNQDTGCQFARCQ